MKTEETMITEVDFDLIERKYDIATGRIDDKIDRKENQINTLRNNCKHKYKPNQKPNVMGRGYCLICGENDY